MPKLLQPGESLRGEKRARYEIVPFKKEKVEMGSGNSAVTYLGRVAEPYPEAVGDKLPIEQEVVIKLPLIEDSQPPTLIRSRLLNIFNQLVSECTALTRLEGLDCAAHFLDYGLHDVQLAPGVLAPAPFSVQERIEGVGLSEKMTEMFRSEKGEFKGIPDGETFFSWAIKITRSLLAIHQRQVVHGDIWHGNIMVNAKGEVVFIDFGEAALRQLIPTGNMRPGTGVRITPPEGPGTIAADVYNLGAIFFYLATGDQPPPAKLGDIDELKREVTEYLVGSNEALYISNRGVVDVIARCLRFQELDRVPNADLLLRDLQTFSSERLTIQEEPSRCAEILTRALESLDSKGSPLFSWMARLRASTLCYTITDMSEGFYDLTGEHEEIVSGLTEYLSSLGKGDQYLTVSIPSFWSRQNLGTNGRFLSMNFVAAQRGATIRRVFLVTPNDDQTEVRRVFEYHEQLAKDMAKYHPEISTAAREVVAGGLFAGFQMVKQEELDQSRRDGKANYGILKKDIGGILITPVYRGATIATIQFRSAPELLSGYRSDFDIRLANARPLSEYVFRVEVELAKHD